MIEAFGMKINMKSALLLPGAGVLKQRHRGAVSTYLN